MLNVWRKLVKSQILDGLRVAEIRLLDDLENCFDVPERMSCENNNALLARWFILAVESHRLTHGEYNILRRALHLEKEIQAIRPVAV